MTITSRRRRVAKVAGGGGAACPWQPEASFVIPREARDDSQQDALCLSWSMPMSPAEDCWAGFRLLDRAELHLVACSAGYDSTGLLSLLSQRGYRLVVGHVRHGWRSESEEAADLRAIRETARRLGVEALCGDLPPTRTEAEARKARYLELEKLAQQVGASTVVTGHHRDDHLETVVLNILRGTGLRGLRGIAARRKLGAVVLLRPALGLRREDLIRQVLCHGLPVNEDRCNMEGRGERSRLRREVMPTLSPPLRAVLARMSAAARQLDRSLRRLRAWETRPMLPARAASWPVLLLGTGAGKIPDLNIDAAERLRDVLMKGRGVADLLGGWRAFGARGGARLEPENLPTCPVRTLRIPGACDLGASGTIRARLLEIGEEPPEERVTVVFLAASEIAGELEVGPRALGDRLSPAGFSGHRKLKHLFREGEIPNSRRHAWPVLRDRDGVLWVPGLSRARRAASGAICGRVVELLWQPPAGFLPPNCR